MAEAFYIAVIPLIDDEASSRGTFNARRLSQLVSWADPDLVQLAEKKKLMPRLSYSKANTTAINSLSILKGNPSNIIAVIRFNPGDTFLEQDIQSQLADLLRHQGARIAIQLPRQDPSVAIYQFYAAELLQVHHRLGGLQTQEASSDGDGRLALVTRREFEQALQVGDGSVDKDPVGIVAGGGRWKDGIGASGEHQDVVRDFLAGGRLDQFVIRVDLCDARVEVVIEGAIFERGILLPLATILPDFCLSSSAYPFLRIEIQILDPAMLKEGRQSNAIVGQVRLLTDHDDIILSAFGIEIHQFFS